MADSESKSPLKSPVASSSAVTMVTSLNAPPSDVVEAVNQSNEIVPALFALPSESGDNKKLKLCKRVGWLRDGVFTTGFMEINIKEAKQKGIFNQPRQVTLVQEGDSIFQSQIIQGQKPPSSKQLRSLMIRPGMSTTGLISTQGVIPKKITVVKNVPSIEQSPGKLVALGKAPSLGISANKAETLAKPATGNQNQMEVYEFAKNFSSIETRSHCIASKVDERKLEDSASGSPHLNSHSKEPLLVENQDVRVQTEHIHDAPTGESQACPVKKRRRELKNAPRITRVKKKDSISSEANLLCSLQTDTYRLQSSSNPKLDILKLDIDFSRHNVLQMEGLIKSPCDPTSSEFNSSGQIKLPETTQRFSDKSQKASELYSPLSKDTTNKPLGNQTTAQSKSRTVKNLQRTPEFSKQTSVAEQQEQSTDALVRGAEEQGEFSLRKRKFDETSCTPSNYTAATKLNDNISGELSTPELSVKYTRVVDSETPDSDTPKANLGSSNCHSQHYDTDPFVQKKQEGCSQVSFSSNTYILIQNKIPKGAAPDTSDNLTHADSVQDIDVEASSQNNNGMSTNLPMSPLQTLGQQTSTASRAIPVNLSTSVNSDFELTDDHHLGNISRKHLSTTTILETNNEQSSLPSDSSVDKKLIDQASDRFPLLQIDSVYSLSAEEAKRLFPKASIEKSSELVEINQSPVDTDSNIPVSSATSDPVVEPSATQVELEPLDTSRDSQPSQPQTSDTSVCPGETQTIETISSTPGTLQITRPSSSTTSNSKVTSTGMNTIPLAPVVCINGQVLKLVPSRLPGNVNKAPQNPMELLVISQKNVAHNVDQNVTPKPLLVCHSPMPGIQIWKPPSQQHLKAPATSINVTSSTSRTSTFLNPSINKSSLIPNIGNVHVQSTIRRSPLFHSRSFVECKTTSIPASVMPTVVSDVSSSSTSVGSVCTAISSSSSAGSICSTETDTQKPTQPEIFIASHFQNISESEEQRTFLITTTQGQKKIVSFPSTADGVHILSQVAQKREYQIVLKHLKDKIHRVISKNDVILEKAREVSKHTQGLRRRSRNGDKNKKKGNSLKIKIDKNPQSDLVERPVTRKRRRHDKPSPAKMNTNGPSGSHKKKATTSNVTTRALGKSLQVTHNKDLGDKCNTSEVTKPSSQCDGNPDSRTPLPRPNNKRKTWISSNIQEKGAGLSLDDKKKASTPETQPNVSRKGRTPATPLNTTNQKGATPSSQLNVRKKGRTPATPPSSQLNVSKKGRPPATPMNTNQKSTTPSSQSNVSKKGRTSAIPSNTNRRGSTPSSQSNVRRKGRTQATPSNVDQKGALPSSQSAVNHERSTPSFPSNVIKKSCSTSSPADVNQTSNAQTTRSCVNKRRTSTSPATRSSVKKRINTTSSPSHVNQKSSVPANRSSVNKNDTTISSLSDVYLESSSPSYIFREGRLIQLKKLIKQKEKDIEDMRKLRQLEEREKLMDPELCDL